MERAEGERAETYRSEAVARQRAIEVERNSARVGGPLRDEESNALIRETPGGKAEDALARRVEPLEIVDGDEDRARACERAQCAKECNGHRAGLRRPALGLDDQERDFERPTLRRRQQRAHVLQKRIEEISDAGERKLRLGLGGTGDEEPKRAFAASLDARLPEGRLADPGLARQDDPGRPVPVRNRREERDDRVFLLVPSDDGCAHPGYSS